MRRSRIAGIGIIVCALCMFGIVKSGVIPEPSKSKKKQEPAATRLDGPPSIAPDTSLQDKVEQIPTGTSTIPTFPKTLHLSSLDAPGDASIVEKGEQEYQLVGLGIRTVSFLGIQVYVVGLYIAVPDIATLQQRLVRKMDPIATTLVPGERQKLRELLMDPEKGEEAWDDILKDGGIRTAFRIVPTRNTDFMHLRDGWVRGITGKTQARTAAGDHSFNDETFGDSVNQFKAVWGSGARKSVLKGETLMLTRDAQGKMAAWIEEKQGSLRLGGVDDERISRLIWLGYLGGKNVSSEAARRSVVDGVMDFVERPVGTVAQQVI
jgi:Chalcone isomerase like